MRIFLSAPIQEFLTTSFTFAEARDLLPSVCEKIKRIPLVNLELILNTLPISIFDRGRYQSEFEGAYKLIGQKDKKDADLLALAMYEKSPIWSEDSDFKIKEIKQKIKCYTTSELFHLWERKI